MIIVINKKKQAPWQNEYERHVKECLSDLGVPFSEMPIGEVPQLTRDFCWVMHPEDILPLAKQSGNAKIISQVNGTYAIPYAAHTHKFEEYCQMTRAIDYAIVFDNDAGLEIKRVLEIKESKGPKFIAAGYPVQPPVLSLGIARAPIEKRKKVSIVGGRFVESKMPTLAAALLTPYLKEYSVVFCTPCKPYDEDLVKRLKHAGFEIEICSYRQYLRKVSVADIFFTASINETTNVSLVEAAFCGCYPLAPYHAGPIPPYRSYLSDGYEPWSEKSVEHFIKNRPPIRIDWSLFRPEKFVQKVLRGIGLKK